MADKTSLTAESAKPQPVHDISVLRSYVLSQFAAIMATAVDVLTLVLWVEVASGWYVVGSALGAVNGGVVAFLVNRGWSFRVAHLSWRPQAFRYAAVWTGSLLLNCALIYVLTDGLHIVYGLSKILTGVLVGLCFNFPLHRYFVFRNERGHEASDDCQAR